MGKNVLWFLSTFSQTHSYSSSDALVQIFPFKVKFISQYEISRGLHSIYNILFYSLSPCSLILKGRRFTYHHCRPCPICYSHTNNHATKRHIKLIKKTTMAILYLILSQYTSKLQTKGITNHLFAVRPKQKKRWDYVMDVLATVNNVYINLHHLLIFLNAHSMLWHLLSISFDSKRSDWIHHMLYFIWSFKEIKPNTNSIQYME